MKTRNQLGQLLRNVVKMLSYTWQASVIEIPLWYQSVSACAADVPLIYKTLLYRGEFSSWEYPPPRCKNPSLVSFKFLDWPWDFQLSETLMSHFVELYSCRPKCFLTMSKPRDICNSVQGYSVFHLVVFRERVREWGGKPVSMTKDNMDQILIHHLVH